MSFLRIIIVVRNYCFNTCSIFSESFCRDFVSLCLIAKFLCKVARGAVFSKDWNSTSITIIHDPKHVRINAHFCRYEWRHCFCQTFFCHLAIFPVLFPFNGVNGVSNFVECHKYVLFLLKWNFSPYVDSNVHYIETFENRSDTLHMRYTGIRHI